MASNNLPAGAFFTSIEGRRCTAIPRVAVASPDVNTPPPAQTTPPAAIVTTTPEPAPAAPTTAVVVVGAGDNRTDPAANNGNEVEQEVVAPSTTSSPQAVINPTPIIEPPPPPPPPPPSPAPEPVPVVQAPAEISPAPVAAQPQVSLSPLPVTQPDAGANLQSFTVIADRPSQQFMIQPSATQNSQTDNRVIASSTDALSGSSETDASDSLVPPPGLLPNGGPAAAPASPTIGGGTPQGTGSNGSGAFPDTDSAAGSSVASNSNAVQSTLAVAGGVIGGVVALSIIAFLVWWWRRRLFKKRRSTLLTPLDATSFDRNEKGGPYIIQRGSIGPTPVSEKVKAALGMNFKKIRAHVRNKTGGGSSSVQSVDLDRGTSQFIDASNVAHSRNGSAGVNTRGGEAPTTKDKFIDFFSRMKPGIVGFKSKDRRDPASDNLAAMGTYSEKYNTNTNTNTNPPTAAAQADFLTLLTMDESELDREAQRRRGSLSRNNRRSTSSTDHFLSGRLNLFSSPNDNDNPFSDANAIIPPPRSSAQPAPLNPFSDANAIKPPTTYITDIRRSRGGQSFTSSPSAPPRQPSTVYNNNPLRDSSSTTTTFLPGGGGRNKFRSDPFDLERPEFLGMGNIPPPILVEGKKASIISSTAGTVGTGSVNGSIMISKPQSAVVVDGGGGSSNDRGRRGESFSSKYSSGVSSLGGFDGVGWSDPGPDVGPAVAARKTSPVTTGWGTVVDEEMGMGNGMEIRRVGTGGSGRSVGKAM
ncbi:hypothetical protein QBC40DRAFT_344176 [Triangularia verruculosa]|uniref:Uncharacterized protein n=1 Tax=Triangularia verruculosa TaxID=2587418 RepID=A0AAN6X5L4_9PEZI|nr:hypothetical protein QBC40DRAFT_344176 [Triangularia verruculosa]